MTASGYERDLERFGIERKWQVVGTNPRYTFGVKCSKCPSFRDRAYRMEPPPDQIAKQLRIEGWHIDGKENTCPVCIQKLKEQRRAKQAMTGTTQDTTKATVAVYEALIKAYNREAGRYRQGHDDVSVAQEAKVSPVFVERVREASFGKMKIDPELEKIERDIADMQAMLDELKSRVARAKK
jgi:hypothetical protein